MGKSILGSENSQFKDLRAGACWACLRNSKGGYRDQRLKARRPDAEPTMGRTGLVQGSGFLETIVN